MENDIVLIDFDVQFHRVIDHFHDSFAILLGFLWMFFALIEFNELLNFFNNPLEMFAHRTNIIATANEVARDGRYAK